MFCHRLPSLLEYLREPLQAGLGDRSAYVRKTAVMGIVKVFYVAPQFISGELKIRMKKKYTIKKLESVGSGNIKFVKF